MYEDNNIIQNIVCVAIILGVVVLHHIIWYVGLSHVLGSGLTVLVLSATDVAIYKYTGNN